MTDSNYRLAGYSLPSPSTSGFVIPVFQFCDSYWTQRLDGDEVVGFEQWTGDVTLVESNIKDTTKYAKPIFGFAVSKDEAYFGVREELAIDLSRILNRIDKNPFLKLEILMYLEQRQGLVETVEMAANQIEKTSRKISERWKNNKFSELTGLGLLDSPIETRPSSRRVLVVDDSATIRRVTGKMLSKAGYVVTFAASGKEALSSLEDEIPDLVILDIKMPDMNGIEVCRYIRRESSTRNLPVVFISSLDKSKVEKPISFLTNSPFVRKPLRPPIFLSTIAEVFSKTKLI